MSSAIAEDYAVFISTTGTIPLLLKKGTVLFEKATVSPNYMLLEHGTYAAMEGLLKQVMNNKSIYHHEEE